MLGEPPPTNYDLNFSILGVPVKVHPWFWIVALIMGADNSPLEVLLWVIVLFVSILVHELGHVVAFRYFGVWARVVLHSFGGLAIPEGHAHRSERGYGGTFSRVVVSLAGPVAGFLLAAIVAAAVQAAGHRVEPGPFYGLPILFEQFDSEPLNAMIWDLLWVNVFWGLINLFPIWPLDGGQVSRALLLHVRGGRGMIESLWLSMLASGALAFFFFTRLQSPFAGILFAWMAFNSYQELNASQGRAY